MAQIDPQDRERFWQPPAPERPPSGSPDERDTVYRPPLPPDERPPLVGIPDYARAEPIAGLPPIQPQGNLPGNPFVGWRADPFNQFLAGAYNTVAPVFAPQVYTPLGQQYNAALPVNAPVPYQPPQGTPARPMALPPDERVSTAQYPLPPGAPGQYPQQIPAQSRYDRMNDPYAPTTDTPAEPGAPQPVGQKERDFQSKIIRLMQEETLAPTLESAGLRGKGFMFYLLDEGSRVGRIPTLDQMNQFSAGELRAMVQDANLKGYFTPDRINQRDAAFRAQAARFEQQRRETEPTRAPYNNPPVPQYPQPYPYRPSYRR